MAGEQVLIDARFEPTATTYYVLTTSLPFALSIVGIPLLLVVVPLSQWYFRRYYARLRVTLTTRDLKVARGLMMREEKSIPLEKITDLAVFQGPIMRKLQLKGLKVETAGQTTNIHGALVRVIGIEDTDGFRDRVLAQRDRITDRDLAASASATPAGSGEMAAAPVLTLLGEIRDTLARIEKQLVK